MTIAVDMGRKATKKKNNKSMLIAVNCLKFAPKWSISYFQPVLVAIFVTIATVTDKLISDLYTLVIVLINH